MTRSRPLIGQYNVKFLNVTFHLVLQDINCSKFYHFFIWVSARFQSLLIFTGTHHVDLGTPNAMGSLEKAPLQLRVKFYLGNELTEGIKNRLDSGANG